jgi:hypothetical protein
VVDEPLPETIHDLNRPGIPGGFDS